MSQYLNLDSNFVNELPRFRLPMMTEVGGVYRAFEVAGDSMFPIRSGTTIVARYVEEWSSVKNGTPCIIVSQSEGIQFRRLFVQDAVLGLHCDNPLFPSTELAIGQVLEIWEAKSYISSAFPIGSPSLEHLKELVLDLTEQVKKLNHSPAAALPQ